MADSAGVADGAGKGIGLGSKDGRERTEPID